MKIDTEYLINLIAKHKDHLSLSAMKPLFQTVKGDCTNVPDCILMYLLILEHKPRHVVEFSPMLGYSTRYLASALKILDKPDSMITVEINQNYFTRTGERLNKAGLLHICHVLSGDAISVVKKEITTRNRQVDFIFIDSDHSYKFGLRYIKEIFPLLAIAVAYSQNRGWLLYFFSYIMLPIWGCLFLMLSIINVKISSLIF